MKRRLWMRIHAAGGPIRVYVWDGPVVRAAPQNYPGSYAGFWDRTVREIDVSLSEGELDAKLTLVHELLHVCFDGMPDDDVLRVLGSKDREEKVIGFLEGKVFDLLARNGFLKIPRPPKRAAKKGG